MIVNMKNFVLVIALVSSVMAQSSQSQNLRDCMWNCPKTPEYNPICGSDSEQYFNPSHLLCAQKCGVDVQATRSAPCSRPPAPTDAPSPRPTETTQPPRPRPTQPPRPRPTKAPITDDPWIWD